MQKTSLCYISVFFCNKCYLLRFCYSVNSSVQTTQRFVHMFICLFIFIYYTLIIIIITKVLI